MRALIFDLDGVIADTSQAHYRSWQEIADAGNISFDQAANDALLGRTREDSLTVLLGERRLSTADRHAWLARKQALFIAELDAMGPADLLPGIAPLLAEARARGVPCALASSSRNARAVIDRLGIAHYFTTIADGQSVAHPKPAPDIFLHVAAAMRVFPHECVVIEDSPAGIEAATRGGFRFVSVGAVERSAHHFTSLAGVTLDQVFARSAERGVR